MPSYRPLQIGDIQINIEIEGDARIVQSALQNLQRQGLSIKAHLVMGVREPRFRTTEAHELPVIEEGRVDAALEQLERLNQQSRISPDTDQKADQFIQWLKDFTAP